MGLAEVEREKYEHIWQFGEYRKDESQGGKYIDAFYELCKPISGDKVYDLGCGDGNAGLELKERGLDVWWLDLTDVGLLPEVPRIRFIKSPLWGRWKIGPIVKFGYCTEVMEHIPPEYSMLSAKRVLDNCQTAFFTICNRLDSHGPGLLGFPLHLTVRSYQWWLEAFEEIGNVHDARDLCGQSLFVVSR